MTITRMDWHKGKVEAFYNGFSRRLIADYIHGNRRVEAALSFAIGWIPNHGKRVLDIGCGIGWSTWEIKRHCPDVFVLGIDLSPEMVSIAQKLFEKNELQFAAQDVTEWNEELFNPPFDAIVMLDVYEHIPVKHRHTFHQILAKALTTNGSVILSFPSLFHQELIRTKHPERLQPVDENVALSDIAELGCAIDGHVIYYNHMNIWRNKDYVHAVIRRDPMFSSRGTRNHANYPVLVTLEPKQTRVARVRSRLNARVTREGDLLPIREGSRTICVISPSKNAYSESFIRAHVEHLPANIHTLFGGTFPRYRDDGKDLISNAYLQRLARRFLQEVFRLPSSRFQNAALTRFLKRKRVDAVLAEYGPTGVAVMEACREANIPLIVHFHGYDAYKYGVLEEWGQQYHDLFDASAAVIVVSRDMERQLLELGAPREKLHYNPYGVDLSLFGGAQPDRAPPLFIAVGRFVDKKAPHLTLLAFKDALSEVPEAQLVMIGDGPLLEACKQIANAGGIADSVSFLGVQPHKSVASRMRQARVFVQHSVRPSHGDSEGMPVAVLEAGAAGLPVIATQHAGIQDVVLNGKTGFLVSEGAVEEMAKRMVQLARDPALAARLGKAARNHISANFPLQRHIDDLSGIIEVAIQARRE